jgi:hypothetical protein
MASKSQQRYGGCTLPGNAVSGAAAPWPFAECVRSELAPLALHAYPEAYLEFKRLLLLLVFDEPRAAQRAQLAGEWAVAMRSELSEIVYHTMRRALGMLSYRMVGKTWHYG